MKDGYEITTKYSKDLILQETNFTGSDSIMDMTTNIIKLQEEGVREALIKLGWTPPETDLQKENDELRAKLSVLAVSEESIRLAIKSMELAKKDNSGFEPSLSVYQREVDHVISIANRTPAQSLAEIKAEAVGKFTECVRYNFEGSMNADSLEDFADEYANKLKGGEL